MSLGPPGWKFWCRIQYPWHLIICTYSPPQPLCLSPHHPKHTQRLCLSDSKGSSQIHQPLSCLWATFHSIQNGQLLFILPNPTQSHCLCESFHSPLSMRANSLQLCLTLGYSESQAPLSMGFSRQESWSGSPCPPPGDLPDPGIKPTSLMSLALVGRFFTTSATWKVQSYRMTKQSISLLGI